MTALASVYSAREAGRWKVFQWHDEAVLEVEQAAGFQYREEWGGSAPAWAIEQRQTAWFAYARTQLQRRHVEKISERRRLSAANLADMVSRTATLAARQARADKLRAVVAPAHIEADETELQPTDRVTPLGERGPPAPRASSRDRGPGRPIHLFKSIVQTGMSGGDV